MKKYVKSARVPKTKEQLVWQSNYYDGGGWYDAGYLENGYKAWCDDEESCRALRQRFKESKEKDSYGDNRLITRRVPNPDYVEPNPDMVTDITVNQLINGYKQNRPDGHFFDDDTLKFFGERKSDMKVSRDLVKVKDYRGNEHTCYELKTKQRKAPGGPKDSYHYFDTTTFDEVITSATDIECVGHNDPGQYYDLIDYFDVWGNEEDGWEVNDQAVVEEKIWISDDTTEEELFNYLKDTVGYFNRNTKFSDVEIQWYDSDFIEIFQASDGCPVCSLRKSYMK